MMVGPAGFLASSAAVLVLRNWLRKQIQPNQDYPAPPRLPRGCPPPLIINTENGQLERATGRSETGDPAVQWVEFQIGRFALPPYCCRCLHVAEPNSAYRLPVLPAIEVAVPFCVTCARQRTKHKWLVGLITFALTAGMGCGLLAAMRLDEAESLIFMAAFVIAAIAAAAATAHRVTAPVRAKVVDASRGIVRLWFRNEEYRRRTVLASENMG